MFAVNVLMTSFTSYVAI